MACMCLTGFPDAIQSVFPKTDVQLCIVHQIRNSVKYVGSKNQKEFLSDLKLVYGASTSETGSILCDKFNVFYGFVWKNEIKFVPLPRQERTRWFTPPAVPGTAAWQSSVDIPNIRSISDSLQKEK